MCVLLFDLFDVEKLRFSKRWKSNFLGKKIWKNALALENKEVQGIFEKTNITFFSAVFRLRKRVSDFF